MNVLFVGLARTIWLFDFASLNPTGMSLRNVLGELARRYQFAKSPTNELDFEENRLFFKSGTFVGQRQVPIMASLSIYSDGLVADTMSSTDESTEFLNDLSKWLTDTFGMAVPKLRGINYVSQIDFQSDVSLIKLNHRLEPFAANLQAFTQDKTRHYEVGAIQLWTEDVGKSGSAAPVKIERKISAPFSANHYFSQAPLQTAAHIELLNEFEAILRAR